MIDKKYHYVYLIDYPNGMKYIGVRSCNCEISEDSYLGSGFHIPEDVKLLGIKTILSIHSTREEAFTEEIRLHAELDVKNNPNYYNQCNSTSTKFYPSEEALKRSAETRRGRTKESHDYIRKQVEARKVYVGDNRTEAQKAQFSAEKMPERMKKYHETLATTMSDPVKAAKIKEARVRGGKSCTGIPNPKKSNPGLKHGRAVPWYYVTPDGIRVDVFDSVRGFYKKNPNTLPMSKDLVMKYLREGLPKSRKDEGWDFGKITGTE
jgi:hypothetical protein